jgi:hypothetical protein
MSRYMVATGTEVKRNKMLSEDKLHHMYVSHRLHHLLHACDFNQNNNLKHGRNVLKIIA